MAIIEWQRWERCGCGRARAPARLACLRGDAHVALYDIVDIPEIARFFLLFQGDREIQGPCRRHILVIEGSAPPATSPFFNSVRYNPLKIEIPYAQPARGAYVAAMGPIASLRSLWTFPHFRRMGSPGGCGYCLPLTSLPTHSRRRRRRRRRRSRSRSRSRNRRRTLSRERDRNVEG
jgi:hypothetical protein